MAPSTTLGRGDGDVVSPWVAPVSTLGLTPDRREPAYARDVRGIGPVPVATGSQGDRDVARAPLRELRATDVAVPAGILLVGVLELVAFRPDGWGWAVLLQAVTATLAVWRRHRPLVVAPTAATVLLLTPWIGPQLDDVATPILFLAVLFYSLGRWVPDLWGIAGLAVVAAVTWVDYALVDQRDHNLTDLVFVASLMLPPYVFGRITRRLAVQSEALLRAQELVRRQAVQEERDRIARDLHDVIAHSVSAMVVQTAAAQDLVRTDPDRAAGLLADVADTGRRALSETGRLLHVLRDDNDELGLAPAPGIAELPDLVQRFREQGLAVDADLPDPVPVVPAGVDVSAYRIAQELLTNALRYAADRTVALRVAVTGESLAIRASNASDGRAGAGSGLGLLGVAERVKVHGGTLRHSAHDGRFELEARLPVVGA